MKDLAITGIIGIVAIVFIVVLVSRPAPNIQVDKLPDDDVVGLATHTSLVQDTNEEHTVRRKLCVGSRLDILYDDGSLGSAYCKFGCEQIDSFVARCR